tara:strand:+ start:274 stop:501 length:228 start_codon:yes stop_codon:yes gene_type:complete
MNTITVTYSLIYQFKEATEYKVTRCKKVFNTKTGRLIRKVKNGGSYGYWIKGDFVVISKDKDSPLEKIPKSRCPF